jgi:hypothetical protein
MVRDRVHRDCKRQEMAGHNEDDQKQLSNSEQFSPEPAHQNLPRVGHVLDMRVPPSKLHTLAKRASVNPSTYLSNGISCIGGHKPQANEKDNSPSLLSAPE